MLANEQMIAPFPPGSVERVALQSQQYPMPKGYYARSRNMTWLQLLSKEFGKAGIDWSVTHSDRNVTVRFRSDAEGIRWTTRTSSGG